MDGQTDAAFYTKKSAMSIWNVGKAFCLVESTVKPLLKMWYKETSFIGIRTEDRTSTVCFPVTDYILPCDFTGADSIKNNFNRSS